MVILTVLQYNIFRFQFANTMLESGGGWAFHPKSRYRSKNKSVVTEGGRDTKGMATE